MPNELYKKINVSLGKNCQVSPFCSLENVVMGDNVIIGDGVQLKNVHIEDNTKLGRNVSFYTSDEKKTIEIGSNCWISYGVFGEATGGKICIEDEATIAHNCTFLTSSGPGQKNKKMSLIYEEEQGPIVIGKNSWIGAHCVFLPNVVLNQGVVIGTHSSVFSGDYTSWSVYGGTPAKLIKKIDQGKID